MGAIFSGPKMPTPAPPVAPPSRSDSEVAAAALRERTMRRAMIGRQATIATSDEGDTSLAPGRRTMLGGYSR